MGLVFVGGEVAIGVEGGLFGGVWNDRGGTQNMCKYAIKVQ